MGFKRRFQLWSARKQGKAYKTPAAAPSLEYRTLELMTDRKKMMLDNMNCEVRSYLGSQRYKSEVQPELCGMMGACMLGRMFLKSGSDLPEDSVYGNTLIKSGQVMCRVGEIQTDADQCIRERFLRPLIKTLEEDIRHFEYERKQLDERRVEFELCTTRWENKRNDVDCETKMITARNRYESSLRSLQDLMLRINMREQEEVESLRCFFLALLHEFRESANLIEQSLPTLFDPSVRGDPIHRPLAELPSDIRPRITTVSQNAPYQLDLPPQMPATYWSRETQGAQGGAPAPLGTVPEQNQQQNQQTTQEAPQQQQQQPSSSFENERYVMAGANQSQFALEEQRHHHLTHPNYTSRFTLPPREGDYGYGGVQQQSQYQGVQRTMSQQGNQSGSFSSPYIAVKHGGASSAGYYYGGRNIPTADEQMLSSQYQPLSGQAQRVKMEQQQQQTSRSASPQQSAIRSPEEDPSRWAMQESKATRVSSSYEVPGESAKISAGDSVKVTARSNDGNWVYGEINNRKFVLPAKLVEA